MSILYENYIAGDNDGHALVSVGDNMAAQTFAPRTSHYLKKVRLLMYRVGEPGTVNVAIRPTVDGKPDDSVEELGSGSFDGNELTESAGGEWKEIIVTYYFSRVILEANVTYAIEVEGEGATADNYVVWRLDKTAPGYTRGQFGVSDDGGETWTMDDGKDAMFEEWGDSIVTADKTAVGDKVSLEAIRNIEIVYGGRAFIGKAGDFVYESRYHRRG